MHCLRNLAYCRAWWESGQPHADKDFWVNANGNFVEISVLEWCKLFGEKKRGKYFYGQVVPDAGDFLAAMLAHLGMTEADWDTYVDSMKTYRDKYIAHWDEDLDGAHRPVMDITKNSTVYLLDWLTENGEDDAHWPAPQNAAVFYEQRKTHALEACNAAYF